MQAVKRAEKLQPTLYPVHDMNSTTGLKVWDFAKLGSGCLYKRCVTLILNWAWMDVWKDLLCVSCFFLKLASSSSWQHTENLSARARLWCTMTLWIILGESDSFILLVKQVLQQKNELLFSPFLNLTSFKIITEE